MAVATKAKKKRQRTEKKNKFIGIPHAEIIILSLLKQNKHYAYRMKDAILNVSSVLDFKKSEILATIESLKKKNCIKGEWIGKETEGGCRKYYSITAHGDAELEKQRIRYLETNRAINKVLNLAKHAD